MYNNTIIFFLNYYNIVLYYLIGMLLQSILSLFSPAGAREPYLLTSLIIDHIFQK
jgi:hypothetical protein